MAKGDGSDSGEPLESNVDFAGVQARQQGASAASQKAFPLPLLGFVATLNGLGGGIVLGGGVSGFSFTASPGNLTLVSPQAWASYSPTITSAGGVLTAASATGKFLQIGKTVFFRVAASITTNGTGATAIRISLPAPPVADQSCSGLELNITGNMLRGYIRASPARLEVTYYDSTYPGADGASLCLSGSYESS